MAAAKTARGTTKQSGRKTVESVNWPCDDKGPMVQISFTASELIPTGNYANVTVGPATATKFVPDDGKLESHLNELAELIESEVIAEQRVLVLESLQADVEAKQAAKKS